MSKDSKGDKSFPERLKRWFKIERGNAPGVRDIRLTEELRLELSSDSPAPVRLKAIRELTEVLASRRLEEYGMEKLWTLVRDLLSLPCPPEHRHTTLQMLTTLAAGHDRLGPMRHVFYTYIVENYQLEDTKPIFDFFREVIAEGKQLEYIDEYVGPFLLNWLPGLLSSPQAADALNLIIILVKFNSAYLDEPVVTGFVKQVVLQLHRASSEAEALLCLRVLDAVLAYSYLPSSALPTFITALTRAVNVPQLTAESWKIMRNLLGTHLGNSGLFVLCRLIQSNCDAHMIRGGIFFVTSALWGSNKVSSLHYKPAAVLPNLREASKNNHVLVVYEIALSVQKLVSKMYMELHFSSWDLVLDILNSLFEHTVAMENGTEKQTILGLLKDILDAIEQLLDLHQFGGSADKFFSLVDKYSELRPESSVMRLLDHLALRADPLRPHWLANLGTLLNQYFRRDPRPNVRTKALAILSEVYNKNRHIYGKEMVRNVITIQMEGIQKEEDVGVRTAAVNLLVHIALTQKSEVVPDILTLLENIVMVPYQGSGSAVQVMRESEAADIIAAVAGLIRIFKKKLWTLPSSHAIQAYGILISCLEYHYKSQALLDSVPRVRQQIFEMIFEMRANSKYQLGFSRMPERPGDDNKDSISALVPPFSPYIVVDHKHGQRLHLAHLHKEEEEEEEQEQEELGLASGLKNDFNKEEKEYVVGAGWDTSSKHKVEITHLSLTQAAMIVIVAMKKEKDWDVLRMILERVPQVLQNKALILSRDAKDIDYFASTLCALVMEKSLGLPESLHNTPSKFTRSDFQSYVFPVLASLASYHAHMDPFFQQKVIKCLELGVVSRCAGPLCVSALTLCVLEMRDSMIKLLREVMLNLSKITATVQNAQPILEFISTFLHLPKVYASFVSDQYMSIFAIAIPYTNPFKFNHYIVSLAYHVIAMWFLKCRLPFRRAFVQFITKNLSMILSNEDANTRRRSASASTGEQGQGKGEEMIQFHNDLLETIVDLMSRYTYASCTPLPKRSSVAKMLINGGQEQTWIVGNKIITVTTSGCGQRPMRNGLCDKCIQQCRKENNVAPADTLPPSTATASRRRHRSELHRTISHEAKYKPQSKDDLHMRSIIRDLGDGITPIDQDPTSPWPSGGFGDSAVREPPSERLAPSSSGGSGADAAAATAAASAAAAAAAAAAEEERRPRLCACWCLGWAEIHIRQPTGNMSWMMRIQNEQQLLPLGMEELPLHDLSSLFSPTSSSSSSQGGQSGTGYPRRKISSLTLEDQKNEELLSQTFEELRPRAFSGASDKTQDSDLGSQKDFSGSSSGAPSHASSDPRINTTDPGEDTRESSPLTTTTTTTTTTSGDNLEDPRVPVQRCHSSPEMSEGAVVGGEESSPPCEYRPPASPTPASPLPEMSPSPPPLSRAKLSPRFESVMDSSVGSTSPPPPTASTRVRHTSALQMTSGGSNSSISSAGGGITCSTAEGEDSGSPRPIRRDRGHTISDMNPASRKLHLKSAAAAKKMNSMKDIKPGISPCFVFLQLYYLGKLGSNTEKPALLPTHLPEMQRAMRVLDLIRPQETHKIGVLYVAKGQHTEQDILRNSFGSLRYMLFLQGLGSVLELSSVPEDEVFLGGLDTKGIDGKLVCIWHDDVMQVVFHVATMMPTKDSDPNCNSKKRHIGNNYVTIVYNESGQPYSINTIKGQFNHTTVEIVPGDHSTNSVGVLCRPELADFVGGGGSPRLVSDANLPILVRQIALHADLASTIWESLNRPPHSPYASNWLERLRKIRKIRQMVTDTEGTQANQMDFIDMVDSDKWDKRGGAGYWQQFLA